MFPSHPHLPWLTWSSAEVTDICWTCGQAAKLLMFPHRHELLTQMSSWTGKPWIPHLKAHHPRLSPVSLLCLESGSRRGPLYVFLLPSLSSLPPFLLPFLPKYGRASHFMLCLCPFVQGIARTRLIPVVANFQGHEGKSMSPSSKVADFTSLRDEPSTAPVLLHRRGIRCPKRE